MKRTDMKLNNGVTWIDVCGPTKEDLQKISIEKALPMRPFLNCLDPEHLPKYETFGQTVFIVLRIVDPSLDPEADCIEKLTTKIAIFLGPDFIITVHRLDPDFIRDLREEVTLRQGNVDPKELMKHLISDAIMSFDGPLTELEKKAEVFEENIFHGKRRSRLIQDGYYLKRQATSFRKVLKFTVEVMNRLTERPDYLWNDFQDLRTRTDRLLFYSDDVAENVAILLNLHIALSSQKTNEASFRTNEIMRVLTIFSIFFMPLNFIAGIYGMNFENMPELKWAFGYHGVLLVMVAVAIGLFIWVSRRGWLSSIED